MTTQEFKKITRSKIKADGARMVDFYLLSNTVANIIAIRNHRVHMYVSDIFVYGDDEKVVVNYVGELIIFKDL